MGLEKSNLKKWDTEFEIIFINLQPQLVPILPLHTDVRENHSLDIFEQIFSLLFEKDC